MHPGTNDNCSGEVLTVVYENTNDPNNSSIPVTVTVATVDTFQFYAGTTTVTYTITDGNNNTNLITDMCTFDVTIIDDEKPSFPDPTAAIQAALVDEVSVSYSSAIAGQHSGRVNIVLNCNSSSYAADLATLSTYKPDAVDNCDNSPTVTAAAPITTPIIPCATLAGSPIPNTKECLRPRFQTDSIIYTAQTFLLDEPGVNI